MPSFLLKRLMAAMIARVRADGPSVVRDAVGIGSLASVSYGCWMIYHPAGFIVGGAIGFACCLLLSPQDTGGK